MKTPPRSAFTLIELLVVIAIIALLVSILMPALACARTEARRTICHANLKTLSMAFSNYSSEFQDRCASFTWKEGVNYGSPFGTAADPVAAAAHQAVWILRERAYRTDINPIEGWIPHVLYSHLVMNDYMEQRLPEKAMACPEDKLRLLWQKDPENFLDLQPNYERPAGAGNEMKRWPYSSSYQLAPVAWAADSITNGKRTTDQHGLPHNRFYTSQLPMGDRKFADISFPSNKAAWYDQEDRHACRSNPIYFQYDEASQPIAFFDGHVATKKTAKSNFGFRPNTPSVGSNSTNPRGAAPSLIQYTPEPWEAPTLNGSSTQVVPGVYRWTRGGIRGIDFGGRDIDTSSW